MLRAAGAESGVCWKDALYQVLPAWATEGDMKALGIGVEIPTRPGWAVWVEV